MNSFEEIPMSKATLDIWKKSLDLAGYDFKTEQDFLNFVHNDPSPDDIEQKLQTTERNNYVRTHQPSDLVKEIMLQNGDSWTSLSTFYINGDADL